MRSGKVRLLRRVATSGRVLHPKLDGGCRWFGAGRWRVGGTRAVVEEVPGGRRRGWRCRFGYVGAAGSCFDAELSMSLGRPSGSESRQSSRGIRGLRLLLKWSEGRPLRKRHR